MHPCIDCKQSTSDMNHFHHLYEGVVVEICCPCAEKRGYECTLRTIEDSPEEWIDPNSTHLSETREEGVFTHCGINLMDNIGTTRFTSKKEEVTCGGCNG